MPKQNIFSTHLDCNPEYITWFRSTLPDHYFVEFYYFTLLGLLLVGNQSIENYRKARLHRVTRRGRDAQRIEPDARIFCVQGCAGIS